MENQKKQQHFDIHCHVFNLKYLTKEIKSILWDMFIGKYPDKPYSTKDVKTVSYTDPKKNKPKDSVIHKLKEFIIWFWEFSSAIKGTEEENYLHLKNTAKEAWDIDNFGASPLMMDIYYYFDYPITKDSTLNSINLNLLEEIDEKEFNKKYEEIIDHLYSHIKSGTNDLIQESDLTELEKLIEEAKKDDSHKDEENLLNSMGNFEGLYYSSGFKFHMKNLMKLSNKYKKEVYPFFAVDPRRPGAIESLLDESFVGKNGPFYGVKLYPRLGYHPESEPMMQIFEICANRNLPITSHCGKAGFPPNKYCKYPEYGAPKLFEKALKKFPNLRLNLAHLGSADASNQWAIHIVDMMSKYKNLYSDLSCYTSKDELNFKLTEIWNNENNLKERLMFGTDFDIMQATEVISLQEYFENFNTFKMFTKEDIYKMSSVIPKKFLLQE